MHFIISAASRPPLADDEDRADRGKIRARLREAAGNLTKRFMTDGEELRPERLWETKARGETMKRESSPTVLLQVVGSLRRYLHGLPVLGRASVHVALAGEQEVTKWGVDWRVCDGDAFTETKVVDPDEGAKRVLAELRNCQPESGKSLDLEPEQMTLGYISMPRRYEQRVLQPAWVARFRPKGGSTMGVVIAVPASPTAFETDRLSCASVKVLIDRVNVPKNLLPTRRDSSPALAGPHTPDRARCSVCGDQWFATITLTPRRTRSAASLGNLLYCSSAQRYSIVTLVPFTYPISLRPF